MKTWRQKIGLAFLLVLINLPLSPPAVAQNRQPILIVEREKLLLESLAGKDVLAQDQKVRDSLEDEGRRLDDAFRAEELELTKLRPTIAPEEFRALSEAFDAKVVATRLQQKDRVEEENRLVQQRHNDFFAAVGPVLFQVMVEKGASAIIDADRVLVANQSLNITQEVIKRLDDNYLAEQDAQDTPEDQN